MATPPTTKNGLTLADYISVAEHAVEENHPGARRLWHLASTDNYPRAYQNPDYWAALTPVTTYVHDVLDSAGAPHPHLRVTGDGWHVTRTDGAQGMTDGANWIDVRSPATTMTLLHECAHIIRGTGEGAGHDEAFVTALIDLTARHVSPEAAAQLAKIISMFTPADEPRAHPLPDDED